MADRWLNIRHKQAPPALGCRWCGFPTDLHQGMIYVPGRWHLWTEPTRAQIEARIRARLADRRHTRYTGPRT